MNRTNAIYNGEERKDFSIICFCRLATIWQLHYSVRIIFVISNLMLHPIGSGDEAHVAKQSTKP